MRRLNPRRIRVSPAAQQSRLGEPTEPAAAPNVEQMSAACAARPTTKEIDMNWDVIGGKWKQLKGSVQTQWGELTDDEADKVAGDREKLVGMIQEKYGVARDEAERQADDWARSL
jgi:uncharacterized protein YjbJ (UPF0337 family)